MSDADTPVKKQRSVPSLTLGGPQLSLKNAFVYVLFGKDVSLLYITLWLSQWTLWQGNKTKMIIIGGLFSIKMYFVEEKDLKKIFLNFAYLLKCILSLLL